MLIDPGMARVPNDSLAHDMSNQNHVSVDPPFWHSLLNDFGPISRLCLEAKYMCCFLSFADLVIL